jgi:NAD(P)H dehydrogenase (quinone)
MLSEILKELITMNTIAIIYHSTYGHTKLQAEAVFRGVQTVSSITARLYSVEEATERLDELDSADAIILGCPTYMGSMSAGMKTFVEVAVKKWFTLAWKDKIAGVFTNSSSFSGDKLNTLFGLVVNAMQHGMIFVGLGMMPSANKPDDMNRIEGPGPDAHNRVGSFIGPMSASFQVNPPDAPCKGDLETAEIYGRRVAEITLQFLRGRNSPIVSADKPKNKT